MESKCHIKYVVVPIYEGRCPTCGDYQNSQISDKGINDECSKCKITKVVDALIKEDIDITKIDGNFIAGYIIEIETKDKTYIIEANKLYEVDKKCK